MKNIKTVAVIGCGRIANIAHFPALTTIEGVRKLQDGNLGAAVMAAVDASVERSISLENKAKFGDR